MMGDEILEKVAGLIKDECRSDEIVVRIGGDEFVVLLPGTPRRIPQKIAERIRETVNNERVGAVYLSISLGWETKSDAAEG